MRPTGCGGWPQTRYLDQRWADAPAGRLSLDRRMCSAERFSPSSISWRPTRPILAQFLHVVTIGNACQGWHAHCHRVAAGPDSSVACWEHAPHEPAAAAAGWQILYVPCSRVWHKVGASMGSVPGRADLLQLRYEIRNRILFHRRHHPSRAPRVIYHAFSHAIRHLLSRPNRQIGLTMLTGIADGLCNRRGRIGA